MTTKTTTNQGQRGLQGPRDCRDCRDRKDCRDHKDCRDCRTKRTATTGTTGNAVANLLIPDSMQSLPSLQSFVVLQSLSSLQSLQSLQSLSLVYQLQTPYVERQRVRQRRFGVRKHAFVCYIFLGHRKRPNRLSTSHDRRPVFLIVAPASLTSPSIRRPTRIELPSTGLSPVTTGTMIALEAVGSS